MPIFIGLSPDPIQDKPRSFFVWIAGHQAELVHEFSILSHIKEKATSLNNVPCFMLDGRNLTTAHVGYPISAKILLRTKRTPRGEWICSDTGNRFNKEYILIPFTRQLMTCRRFMAWGTLIMAPIDNNSGGEFPDNIPITLIPITSREDMPWQTTKCFCTKTSRNTTPDPDADIGGNYPRIPDEFRQFFDHHDQEQDNPPPSDLANVDRRSPVELSHPLFNDPPDDNVHTTSPTSSFQAGNFNPLTGEINLLARPSNPRPARLRSFNPIAASTSELPPSMTRGISPEITSPAKPRLAVLGEPAPKGSKVPDTAGNLPRGREPSPPSAADLAEAGPSSRPDDGPPPRRSPRLTGSPRKTFKGIGKVITKRKMRSPKGHSKVTVFVPEKNYVQTCMEEYLNRRSRYTRQSRFQRQLRFPLADDDDTYTTDTTDTDTDQQPPRSGAVTPIPPASPSDSTSSRMTVDNSTMTSMESVIEIQVQGQLLETPINDANAIRGSFSMPIRPQPGWRRNVSPAQNLHWPEHVVIHADPSTNSVIKVLTLNEKNDPFYILEAIRCSDAVIHQPDEGIHDTDLLDSSEMIADLTAPVIDISSDTDSSFPLPEFTNSSMSISDVEATKGSSDNTSNPPPSSTSSSNTGLNFPMPNNLTPNDSPTASSLLDSSNSMESSNTLAEDPHRPKGDREEKGGEEEGHAI